MSAADKVGLDADELGMALVDPDWIERTFEAVLSARRIGITATPTIILGRTAIAGWHYYEVMQSLVEQQGLVPSSGKGAESVG
jgi:predicted DsbA family dithiol-disulfide isomerase